MKHLKGRQAPEETRALEVFAQRHHLDFYDLREISVRGRLEGRQVQIDLWDGCAPAFVSETAQFFQAFRAAFGHGTESVLIDGPCLHFELQVKGKLPLGLLLIREDSGSGARRLKAGGAQVPELHVEVDEPDLNGDGVLLFLDGARRDALSKLLANGTGQMRQDRLHWACAAPRAPEAISASFADLVSWARALDPGAAAS